MRKLLALLLASAMLLLAGCSASGGKSVGDAAPLASVKITPADNDTTAPAVTFDTPLTATAPGAKVVIEGDGAEIAAGQNVTYKLAGYKASDGTVLGDTFGAGDQTLSLVDELKEADPEIYGILVGSTVGSWIAYVRPSTEGAATESEAPEGGSAESESAAPATASEILILKVTGAQDAPRLLGQDEVKQLDEAGALPAVKFGKDGTPTISIPEGKEPPNGLAVKVLKEGDGKVLAADSTVTVDYVGVQWADGPNHKAGEAFDSSYETGQPATFGLGQVIAGWTKGLTGQKVGSTVLLTIPASMAYGDDGSSGGPTGTLVFVVDIKSAE
ncbi:peptidylprolyl isomerase [Zafaria cholistanensis]|uniref:peptidylprolyl isomerase n=1 Tax=Zafaria cholistanensis TaxID=1682741 RepID=A0A5A7NMB3_9MICC|nr:FKBP-type peptidyl-prolyl cis-trans isomerase [Zafaria cholistanensis]GER22093.1 peptidylprolyl isomerase [Zafaria cholistanensis]